MAFLLRPRRSAALEPLAHALRHTIILALPHLALLCLSLALLYAASKMSGAPARLKTIVMSPSSGVVPTATLIFAHGLGDTGAGWYDVAQMLSARPALRHMRFVLPNAPVQPVSLNFGQKVSVEDGRLACMPGLLTMNPQMPSWFDSRSSASCATAHPLSTSLITHN